MTSIIPEPTESVMCRMKYSFDVETKATTAPAVVTAVTCSKFAIAGFYLSIAWTLCSHDLYTSPMSPQLLLLSAMTSTRQVIHFLIVP